MKKQLFPLVSLALSLCLSQRALAQQFVVDEIHYSVTEGQECAVTSTQPDDPTAGCSYAGAIEIPASVSYEGETYQVTSVADFAFYFGTDITSISLPEGIKEIGRYAFCGCEFVTEIILPSTLTTLGEFAFGRMNELKSLFIPAAVEEIGEGLTAGDSNLSSITVSASNNSFSSVGGVLFDKDATRLLSSPVKVGTDGAYTLPSTCKTIDNYAFYFSDLSEVTLNEGLEEIGLYAFYAAWNLTSISIPGTVAVISDGAFTGLEYAESITLAEGLQRIGVQAFQGAEKLTELTLPSTVTYIASEAFAGCPLTKITSLAATRAPSLAKQDVFDSSVYSTAQLYVPSEALEKYQKASNWKRFLYINTITGITAPSAVEADAMVSVYSMDGTKIYSGRYSNIRIPHAGNYIIKSGDKTKKEFISR